MIPNILLNVKRKFFQLNLYWRKQKYGYCLLSGWLCKTELSCKNFCLTLNKTGELTKYQLWQRLYCFAMRESSGIKCLVLLTQTVECDLCNSCFECDFEFRIFRWKKKQKSWRTRNGETSLLEVYPSHHAAGRT